MPGVEDVIVAGGGPAGLCAAHAAATAGARVTVLEREPSFGIPTRTSGGTFLADMRALGVPEGLVQPVGRVVFLGPSEQAWFHFAEPVVGILDVRALYQWLAERAGAAGATLRLRHTVQGVTQHASHVDVEVRSAGGPQTLEARIAVDATGTAAVLTGAVGMHPAFRRRGVGAEMDLHAPGWPADLCVLAMGERIAPSGYAWAFCHRPGRVRVGTGVMRPDSDADPRRLLDAVLELPVIREHLAGAQPIEMHAGIIPAEPLRHPVVRDRVVAAGDAAAQASTLVGEGIRFAMRAGDAAGRAAAAAAAGDGRALDQYERTWRRRYARPFATAHRINLRLATFDDAHWDRAVRTVAQTPAWFVASALASDLRARHAARLLLAHPRLALRFLRAAA